VVEHLAVEDRQGFGMATVMARKGVTVAAIGAVLGAMPPEGPGAVFEGSSTLIGTGPGSWLIVQDIAAPDFASRLGETLAGLASVSDQTGGYAVTRVSGDGARKLLQRGAAIDFHPEHFRRGSAATTVIAHIGVIIWQVDDRPTYDVATFRSYASSFRHWLTLTAAAA
jgi:methylglutamate dehydrogenase subunit D